MSLKDIFDSTKSKRNYLSEEDQKEAFKDVESSRNASAIGLKQETFVPQVDYHNPNTFSRFGSAYYYYKGAIERILDYYPYDGSEAEKNEFYNSSLDIEKYILDNLYPRTTGYVLISSGGWGTRDGSLISGYGKPISADVEYISFYGGPGTGSVTSGSTLSLFSPNPYTSKIAQGNIYDENIYQTAGLPSDYGSGSRESNVKSNFDTGVTLEFWLTTGSANTTNITTQTQKQVIFDMWNQNLSSSHNYGRITLSLNGNPGSSSPFLLTVQSGTATFPGTPAAGTFETTIGTGDLNLDSLSAWHHYAVVLYNSGSDLVSRFYVDGKLNEEKGLSVAGGLGELDAKDMQGQLGALITAPSGALDASEVSQLASAGKLSGSLDEFRFWKVKRTGKEIGENWFTQIGGGTNTDISNTTLGVYYKFNEGTTGVSATDSVVLDYSGRVSNGMWTGYAAGSRNSGSAIVSASAAAFEHRDPIVRSNNPDVVSLKSELLDKGNTHDSNNNAAFVNYVPSWIIEEHEDLGNDNLKIISHIMGSYFDKLHLYTSALPQIKTAAYPSASYKPVPFAQHLPQSLGLYTPEVFIDATVMERFTNRDRDSLFEGDLDETKNLIYTNLYNNLTNIFKAKGTEKALRNVLRCFNIDERLVKINTYANNQTFNLDDNVEQVITQQRVLNLNKAVNRGGILYQAQTDSTGETRGYISGTYGAYASADSLFGMTLEADVIMPRYYSIDAAEFNRNYITSSLFGLATVDSASSDSLTGVDTGFVADDWANLQVQVIKEAPESKNVHFRLTSSYGPVTLPELTSSVFYDAYDDTQWNFSVRIKPSMYPVVGNLGGNATAYTYDVIFQGTNVIYGEVVNTFTVTGSMAKQDGINFLTAAKRVYIGAQRTNLTGALLAPSDFYFKNARYWTRYLEDATLARHAQDLDNFGISGSYQNIAPNFQAGYAGAAALANAKYDILNLNALALNWTFDSTTGSTAQGTFSVQDYSSGSTLLRENYGWLGGITGYQLPASGAFFEASATDTAQNKTINAFRFIEPERATSADAVQILSEDDKVFGVVETVPSYVYTVEKSMYRAISEEMLDFFAGVVDFNNVIGEPVNRYRDRYKSLEKLREVFFRRVTQVSDVEKFIDYYKWFDDAISLIMGQLMPASSEFTHDVYNTIESHVLERNKYQTQYPTLETKAADPQAATQGISMLTYDYQYGDSTLPSSPRDTEKHVLFWKQRASRFSEELTSNNTDIDTQRETYRKVIYSHPTLPEGNLILNDPGASQQYAANLYARRTFAKIYDMKPVVSSSIRGGINFSHRKQSELLHNSLYPFGPINRTGGRWIPLNVLLSTQEDIIPITDFADKRDLRLRLKRYFKVQRGRDYEDGLGYYNLKSDFIYPFNIMSSSVTTGYNKLVVEGVSGGIEITNLHHDTYGPDMETPMQSPFTEYAVGGHQSRHVPLNYSSSTKTLDTNADRPEAWKILLGQCADQGSGSLGMAEVTYPYPAIGAAPVTASGTITIAGQPAIEDSVTISDGSSSVTFAVPFSNEKSVLFDGTGGSDNLIVVGGNFSSSLTSPTQRVWPGYCKDTNPTNYGCSGQPNHYYEPKQTWSAWISQSQDDNGYIFATGVPHGNMVLQTRTSNKIRFTQRWIEPALSHNDVYWETEADAFNSGEWQHVAVVFDASLTGSTSASIYINGLEKAITTYPGSGGGTAPGAGDKLYVAAIQDGTWGTPGVTPGYNCGSLSNQPCNSKRNAAVIGGYSNASVAFTGSIDEVNIWRVSMSAEQISELYATGSVKNLYKHSVYLNSETSLNAWWRMGDDSNDAIDGTDDFSAANRIRDIVSNDYGVPYSSVTGFDTNVVTASSEAGDVTWTLGADKTESLLNLQTAINAQNTLGNLSISASVPYGSGLTEVMPLHNEKYGTPTSTKRGARGSLGNVDLYATCSVMSLVGMNGGEDPKIMRYQAPRATYYRDLVAKSPVNIKNIRLTSSSPTVLGNYRHNYEVIQTVGAFYTPRSFVETQPTLPNTITTRGNLTSSEVNSSVVVQNYMALDSNDAWDNQSLAAHFDFELDYLVTTNSGAFENNSIIKSQFGAPGSRETSAPGYRDFRSGEYSPYNTLDYRNLSVLKPSQGPSGTISGEAPTSIETGIRVYDIHGQDFGLYSHRARHAARFGRDSLQVTGTTAATDGPGASYNQLPAMFKVNRNTLRRLKLTDWQTETYTTGSRYDNSNVSHPIPQSDRQYAWITASLISDNDLYGYLPSDFILSTSTGYEDAYTFVTASELVMAIGPRPFAQVWGGDRNHLPPGFTHTPVDMAGMNTIIYEPITASTNTIGYPTVTFVGNSDSYFLSTLNLLNSTYVSGAAGCLDYDLTKNGFVRGAGFYDSLSIAQGYWSSASLKGWWRFNDDVHEPYPDSSGNGKTGSFSSVGSTPTISTEYPSAYLQTGSWDMDGGDYLNIGYDIDWNPILGPTSAGGTAQMSIAMWVNLDSAPLFGSETLMYFGVDNVIVFRNSVNRIGLQTEWNGGAQVYWLTDMTLDDYENEWMHFVITYDANSTANNAVIFINGSVVGSTEYGTAPAGTWDGIGTTGNICRIGPSIDGRLADVAVWNTILNGVEVQNIYQAGAGLSNTNTIWPLGVGGALNGLLLHRNGPFGYPTWKQVRQANNPILRNEKATNRISMVTSSGEVAQYDLFPVSTRGRPISFNLSQQAGGNFTIKSTFNNEKILFTQRQPNDLLGLTTENVITPYDQLVDIATTSTQYDLNWVLYSQNIFPSERNEYQSYARERTNYENLFWRGGLEERSAYGSAIRACEYYTALGTGYVVCNDSAVSRGLFEESAFETPAQYTQNSYGIPSMGAQWYQLSGATSYDYLAVYGTYAAVALSQSSWCLDPPKDFLTRNSTRDANPILQADIAYGGFNSGITFPSGTFWDSVNDARVSGAAGELQNTYVMPLYAVTSYSSGITNAQNTFKRRCAQASPGGLYARKHLLSSPGSCTTPYGPSIWSLDYTTWSNRIINTRFRAFEPKQVWIGGGEALWEAGANAGYFIKTGSTSGQTTFEWVSHPSEPWFDSYDDFKFDLMNIAKDYVIIPEYRMSEHVDDYAKYGLLNPDKMDSLTIPGTKISSSQGQFYQDYTNSEFLKEVLNIKRETLLNAKEIQLVCSAAIRYNPYKGFYPAQRSLDLVSQFSRSYSQNLQTTNFANDGDMNGVEKGTSAAAGYPKDWALFNYGGQFRPVISPLFAPGILYNSIKSGLAVDYPVVTDATKLAYQFTSGSVLDGTGGGIMFGGVGGPDYTSENWILNVNSGALLQRPWDTSGAWDGKPYFDTRLPFETILRPEEFMLGLNMVDLEPHWNSASIAQTGALAAGPSDNLYTMMAQNFFGEVGNFFLNNAGFTKLESRPVPDKLTFKSGSAYGARIRLRRSHNGNRYYNFESSSWVGQVFTLSGGFEPLPTYADGTAMNPENFGYALEGADASLWSAGTVDAYHLVAISASVSSSDYYELPQDPANNPSFKETFTMYSRPTAFGPPLSGRGIYDPTAGGSLAVTGANSEVEFELRYSPLDALNGFNWAYTPGYYHGESWLDIVFYPSASREYTVEEILNESYTVSRRYDNGRSNILRNTASIQAGPTAWGGTFSAPYGGGQIDQQAMQIDASINCLGIEKVQFTETDKFNIPSTQRNVVAGTKWVIQPKFETPMANFSDQGSRPLTASNDTMTLPLVASQSAARGMWHQFGILEPDPNKGIFLEIGDIPANWLKNHYSCASGAASAYNNYDAGVEGYALARDMKSLVDLFGFEKTETSARLGELSNSQTIREAVVAIPYITEEISLGMSTTQQDPLYSQGAYRQTRKKFITIPKERFEAAKKEAIGSEKGDSFIAAGASIRKQLQKMERYVLPPEFDFLTNTQIDPFVMYMFEFEYTFDRDDLNYIWQNIAPRNYKKMELQAQSVAHELMDTELLTEANLTSSETLRWMVFKVKQRSQVKYDDLVIAQADQASNQQFLRDPEIIKKINYQYNWPYDYLSFVEMIKMDAQILFTDDEPPKLVEQTTPDGMTTSGIVREKKSFMKKKKMGGKGGTTKDTIISNKAAPGQIAELQVGGAKDPVIPNKGGGFDGGGKGY